MRGSSSTRSSACSARRSDSYEKPVATIARSSERQSVTWIGRPSGSLPFPRSAAKHSPLTGLNTTPTASPSSSSSAMLTPHARSP